MTDYARIDRETERNEAIWNSIFVLSMIAAWLTSIVNCIMTEKWILLVVDLVFAPIGVLHGLMVWFGVG